MISHKQNQKFITLIYMLLGFAIVFVIGFLIVNKITVQIFGLPEKSIGLPHRIIYPFDLLIHGSDLTKASSIESNEVRFEIQTGESVNLICSRLEQSKLIPSAESLRVYLIYSGLDRQLKPGNFSLNTNMPPIEIAGAITNQNNTTVIFHILPGWRIDEIAESLATSGLNIDKQDFVNLAYNPPEELQKLLGLSEGQSLEGYLFPDKYEFARDISSRDFLNEVVFRFASDLDLGLLDSFSSNGLTIREAVILSSIIQREAIHEEELPLIASVFLNRLDAGMFLETDPTVQYGIGFDPSLNTWWKSPLTYADLEVDSLYNTYRYPGLPPGPICNPGLSALFAVAHPTETPYYFFRARCDESGWHNFAITFEEHLANGCP